MAQILRQSTQVVVVIGPAVAVADGFTPVVTLDLSTADEAEILKANTTTTTSIAAATFAAITGCDGWYGLTLTTSLTDTVGALTVMVNDDSLILPIFARFQVIEEAAYDAIYAASAPGPATPTNITAGTITTATNVTTVNGLAAAVITAASIATNAIDADALAADAVTEIWAGSTAPTAAAVADAVWDEDATAHQTTGTFGQAIGDPVADTNTIYAAVVTGAAGATVAADIIAVKADTAATLADTGTDGVVVAAASKTGYSLTATTGLGNQTSNITGNLSGSVGSVTGAVGSVTGAVGSVAADVNAVLTNGAHGGAAATAQFGGAGGITSDITGSLSGSVGSVTGAVGSVTGAVGSVTGAVGSVTGLTASNLDATVSSRATPAQILTTALTEAYAADGAAPTLTQAVMAIQQFLQEKSIASTTMTVNKLDGTTAAMTFTLDSDTAPTSITRAT